MKYVKFGFDDTLMRISLIIPALNEADSLPYVLRAIPWAQVFEVLVVDGGSRDGTVQQARSNGARVIIETRRGYGRACARGSSAARGQVLVFMDADGADDPGELPRLTAPLLNGKSDLVLGSRLAGRIAPGAMPWHQRAGNLLSAALLRALYDLPLTDLSPYRAVLREKLLSLDMREMTYGWPTEMIVKAAQVGWRIQEIPVVYRPRHGGRSKISGTLRGTILASYHIMATILRHAWRQG